MQEFAWTEEEKPGKVARRNSSLPPGQTAGLQKEPMFCVETMMCCLYWSLLAYDYLDVSHPFVITARLLSKNLPVSFRRALPGPFPQH